VKDLPEVERLGLAALWLRESPSYRYAKHRRPRAGERWDMPRLHISRAASFDQDAGGRYARGRTD
jgi:hypothetical protein